jgi:pimeloyl-ACP methyl ester carboxylesterase/lysophospholipase L1-like esterase
MKNLVRAVAVVALASAAASAVPFPGTQTNWFGWPRWDFEHDGRKCIVVAPTNEAPGRPWIWRARFWGHEPQTDLALLDLGFHVVHMDVAEMFGSPRAVAHWDRFHELLVKGHGFAPKAALEGMSRGGLYIYNWAAANPGKVTCIYADAPVLDVRSWPGGKGRGKGSPQTWAMCLKEFGLTEETAPAFRGNPLDRLEPLARAGIPLLHVCGEADTVVPIEENTRILETRYRELGGKITVIAKPNCEHHPHSLKDPTRIVNFVLENTPGMAGRVRPDPPVPYGEDYFTVRGVPRGWGDQACRVVFLGGSITHNPGWQNMVADSLRRRYPRTQFNFVNAGIPSLGSTPHAFRLARDVLSGGRVDLLFVEAAVNDEANGMTPQEMLRGMEGVVRHARLHQPDMRIVMLHFADPDKTAAYRAGRTPEVIVQHERVAEHYRVSSINLAREVFERMHAGEFTWEKDFKNLHPSPFGQKLYAASVDRWLDANAAPRKDALYTMPPPLDPASYWGGRLVAPGAAGSSKDWNLDPSWVPRDGKGTREGFVRVPMRVAETPGSELEFAFQGRGIGLMIASGPDAGIVEWSVDGTPAQRRDLFTQWSPQLHLPWAVMLDPALPSGAHTLKLRMSADRNPKSAGTACRIAHFLVNE